MREELLFLSFCFIMTLDETDIMPFLGPNGKELVAVTNNYQMGALLTILNA